MTMLAEPLTNELAHLAERVHATWLAAKSHQITAWEGYLEVGSLLLDARTRLSANRDYGHWLEEQEFGFSRQWANRLVRLAENRPAIMEALESALSNGSTPPGVDTLLATLLPPRIEANGSRPDLVYEPDHQTSATVWIIVNYKVGSTLREKGQAHGSGADRAEWDTEIIMGTAIPDSAVALDPFVEELAQRFKRAVREDPFLTMRA